MIVTRLNDEGTMIGDGFSSYTCSKPKRICLMQEVKKEWETFSKADKEHALSFIQANSKYVEMFPYWFLTTYRTDSGKVHKAIGCSEREPGIGLNQLKRYLGVK